MTIPFQGIFWFAQARNVDPAIIAEYHAYAFSLGKQNWSNEYADAPVGPDVIIDTSQERA